MKPNSRITITIFNFLMVAFTFLLIISCSKSKNTEVTTTNNYHPDTAIHNNNPVDSDTKTLLALGDSYTIGQSVPDSERFPVQTVKLLREKNIKIANPDIIAVTGWTTGNLIQFLDTKPPTHNYSFVTLLIGVNNQYQGRNLDEYKAEFTELLNRSIYYAGNIKNHVFVLSIPDYSVTPFASRSDTARISKEIDDFNNVNKSISISTGVHYLDITPISREAKFNPSLIAGDGLHPSSIQYNKWSLLLSQMILKEIH